MYLPLKGDTNDYSTNAQNPTNSGVATTTGQFGESNGAYEWNAGTDYLSWATSVAQSTASLLASNCSIVYFMIRNSFVGGSNNTLSAYADGNSYFQIVGESTSTRTSIGIKNTTATQNIYNSTTATGSWGLYSFTTTPFDATEVTTKFYKNGVEEGVDTGTGRNIKANTGASYNSLRLGDVSFASNAGFIGKIHTFRIYDVTLSDGALKILNNEKGRIRA